MDLLHGCHQASANGVERTTVDTAMVEAESVVVLLVDVVATKVHKLDTLTRSIKSAAT
jgi:ketol-acid reductoisomerase